MVDDYREFKQQFYRNRMANDEREVFKPINEVMLSLIENLKAELSAGVIDPFKLRKEAETCKTLQGFYIYKAEYYERLHKIIDPIVVKEDGKNEPSSYLKLV